MKKQNDDLENRRSPLEMNGEQFRKSGYQLVDQIATFLDSLPRRPVTRGEDPAEIRSLLNNSPVPEKGLPVEQLLQESADLLFEHSLFNGHPRFLGYITSSAAPIGALGDLLAAAVNPNVGGWALSPVASEIELQTIRWIAQLLGYPEDCGGILVSGGNMANFVGFLAGRRSQLNWDVRTQGLQKAQVPLTVYVSRETHTWIQKAADLFGLGTEAIRWISTDTQMRMDVEELNRKIRVDRKQGFFPLMVVGAAGTVGTGAVDPLQDLAAICEENNLWFHVDGAYGAPAALLPESSADLKALALADSVAVDPHKWLYAPLEAGCTLVKNPRHLIDAFSFHPEYYNFDPSQADSAVNFYEFGMQNSRGFRALKVWLAIRQIGRQGYTKLIREDIALAEALFEEVNKHKELQAFTCNLSITTFRYIPPDLTLNGNNETETYLDTLNRELLNRLQAGGETFISNAIIDDIFVLRACVVNFRTTLSDIRAVPEIVIRVGKQVDAELRKSNDTGN
ncbi:MAG: aspartate aminotransferase family protein [bacterium]|nr:MAG: aspartate aminotransferase family protein [bacterium]